MHTGARCCIPFNEFTADSFLSLNWHYRIFVRLSFRFVPFATNILDIMRTSALVFFRLSLSLQATRSDSNARINRSHRCWKPFRRQLEIKDPERCVANTLYTYTAIGILPFLYKLRIRVIRYSRRRRRRPNKCIERTRRETSDRKIVWLAVFIQENHVPRLSKVP